MNIVVFLRDVGSFVRSVAIALLAAAAPMFGFYFLLTSQLAPVREPLWSLPTIFIPAVYCCLWLLRRERSFRSASFALKLTLVHAAAMLALLALGWWRNVAVAALFFDSLLLFALLGPVTEKRESSERYAFSKATIFWIGTILAIFLPLGFLNSVVVVFRAEQLAGERPYCIQYANDADRSPRYDSVRSVFDLSIFRLLNRSSGGGNTGVTFEWKHHGLLALDDDVRRYYNWSYAYEEFRDEVVNRGLFDNDVFRPEIVCRVEPHFAMKLPLWSGSRD